MNIGVRLTRRCTRPRYRAQIGGHTCFVVGCVAEALSRSRAVGDAQAVSRPLQIPVPRIRELR